MRRTFAVALLAVGVLFLVQTLQLDPPARRVPVAVVLPLLALLLIEARREFQSDRAVSASAGGAAGTALLSAAALPLLIALVGMIVGPSLFMLGYLRSRAELRWHSAALISAVTALLLAGVLGPLLHVSVPMGWLLTPFLP